MIRYPCYRSYLIEQLFIVLVECRFFFISWLHTGTYFESIWANISLLWCVTLEWVVLSIGVTHHRWSMEGIKCYGHSCPIAGYYYNTGFITTEIMKLAHQLCHFCTIALALPCSVPDFISTGQMKWVLWRTISCDMNLRLVWCGGWGIEVVGVEQSYTATSPVYITYSPHCLSNRQFFSFPSREYVPGIKCKHAHTSVRII